MVKQRVAPQSLAEAVVYFADLDVAFDFIVKLRWPNGVVCPHCAAEKPMLLKTRRIFKCRDCRKQFSVKVGTIFEDSALGFDKWLPALWMLANCRNGISSYELARTLKVTQKTAWFMLGRIREAMKAKSFVRSQATLEIDESYQGGVLANMHKRRRNALLGRMRGGAGSNKVGMIAAVKRGENGEPSKVVAKVMRSPHAKPHGHLARLMALPGSKVYTDSATIGASSLAGYEREMVNHSAKEFVRGEVHTNSVENFWSVFKRGLKGTYISVDPFHLFRYLDEAVFRYNVRGQSELERFSRAAREVIGSRLTYRGLIGADLWPAT